MEHLVIITAVIYILFHLYFRYKLNKDRNESVYAQILYKAFILEKIKNDEFYINSENISINEVGKWMSTKNESEIKSIIDEASI